MEVSQIRQECNSILSSDSLNPVQKLKGVDNVIKNLFAVRTNIGVDATESSNTADTKADPLNDNLKTYGLENDENGKAEFLTELADQIRKMVRESAWGGNEPISLKEALGEHEHLSESEWELLETFIDHERDYNWNYINLVVFNLKYNKKSDQTDFWLSPQHFRMAAIIDMAVKELDNNRGLDFDLIKKTYNNKNQLPKSISYSLKTLRHSE